MLLRRSGADSAAFADYAGGPGREQHAAIQTQAAESGIIAAPCYVLADEIFVGREHLPMIRWILAGRPAAASSSGSSLRA